MSPTLIFLLILGLFSGCVTGRWVQEGKTDEDIQLDVTDCKTMITEEEGVETLPAEQYTSTRYWEREPPLRPSEDSDHGQGYAAVYGVQGISIFPEVKRYLDSAKLSPALHCPPVFRQPCGVVACILQRSDFSGWLS